MVSESVSTTGGVMAAFKLLITCREALDLLGDDFDRSLPRGKSLALRLHLYLCQNCREYRKTYRTSTELVHSLAEESGIEPGAPLSEEMIRRILAARTEPPRASTEGVSSS